MIQFDSTKFQANLRHLIESRGLLVRQVAEDIGVAPGTITRYQTGKRSPDLEYVVRLANYFGVSFDWLLGLSGDKYDVLPQEIQDFAELYSRATQDDRKVVQAVLEKYKNENWYTNRKDTDK